MVRWTVLLLAALALVAGCGGGDDEPAASAVASETVAVADPIVEFRGAVEDVGRTMRSFGAAADSSAGAAPSANTIDVMQTDLVAMDDALARAEAADLPPGDAAELRDGLMPILNDVRGQMADYIDYALQGDVASLQVVAYRFAESAARIQELE